MGHVSVAARMSIDAGPDSGTAGVSTMAAGIYPAPLVLWSCPGPPFPSSPPVPRVCAVRGLPGIFPAAPLGLGLGQSLVQEGAGMGECAFLQATQVLFPMLKTEPLTIPQASIKV